jgi:hypothetical protein
MLLFRIVFQMLILQLKIIYKKHKFVFLTETYNLIISSLGFNTIKLR